MAEFVKRFKGGGMLNDGSAKPTPAESLKQFNVAPGLRWELAATEPMVRQPLNMHFDERGRLMVIMTHNTDIADGWEREGEDEEFFYRFSIRAYPLGVNIAIYAMTH